jgi:hypothetical protein
VNADDLPHLIRPGRPGYTLCKRMVVSVPELQPATPANVCPDCVQRAEHGAPYLPASTPMTGVCPVCVSEEDLDEQGLIKPHKQMYGSKRTDVDCDGAGEKPEADDA